MKKLFYLLLLITSISYSQNTTIHYYYGSSQTLGSEVLFHLKNTESSYLGGGFSGALNQNKVQGIDLTNHITSKDNQYKIDSLNEEWCSIYGTGSLGFFKQILISCRVGLDVYNKKVTFDNNGYIYNKIDKVVYQPLIGVSGMYSINRDVGISLGFDTFNKATFGFTILF